MGTRHSRFFYNVGSATAKDRQAGAARQQVTAVSKALAKCVPLLEAATRHSLPVEVLYRIPAGVPFFGIGAKEHREPGFWSALLIYDLCGAEVLQQPPDPEAFSPLGWGGLAGLEEAL